MANTKTMMLDIIDLEDDTHYVVPEAFINHLGEVENASQYIQLSRR